MVRKDIYLVETVKADVDTSFNVKGIKFHYDSSENKEDEEEESKSSSTIDIDTIVAMTLPR